MSTTAGTPPDPGNGRPPPEPVPRRGLRDRPLGKVLLLALVLLAALLATRTCASQDTKISQDEAIEIAVKHVGFEPCSEPICVQIRYLQRGIPTHGFWLVGLAETLDANGEPVRPRNVLVDAETGAVTPR